MSGMVECKDCGKKIRNDFTSQFRHIIQDHPLHACRILLPMVTHSDPFQVGQQLGDYAKNQMFKQGQK
jgi:phosphoenolpyruvate-protein kinase (PTS system EI component)